MAQSAQTRGPGLRKTYRAPQTGTPGKRENDGMGGWDSVYALVKKIPRGKVLTYGALAKATSLPGGARAAGRAMAATPKGQGIPWHRVVGAAGKLLIREPYASLQKKLLASEGAKLIESRVDLKSCHWIASSARRAQAAPSPLLTAKRARLRGGACTMLEPECRVGHGE